MRTRALAAASVALTAIAVLAGCAAPEPTAPPTDDTPVDSTPATSDTPTPTADTFSLPDDCREMLPQARMDAFAAQNMVLLGGPGGLYEDYLVDPTPEEIAGGITCIWGDELVPQSTITVSIAPISADTRSAIVEDL